MAREERAPGGGGAPELLDQHLDGLQALRRALRSELLAESRKHKASKLLRQIPCIGPIRAARLIALMQTPHRVRSKRQLWWLGHRDPRQCAISLRARTTATHKTTAADSRSQSESQPRDERDLQGSCRPSQLWCGPVA